MQLISPDILAEAKGLSIGAAGFFALVGLMLWAFGWRWHRFWIVFGMSATAGMIGMSAGKAAGGQVLAIGLLLAFAGGVMALELAKILSFVAGGVGAWLAVQAVLPQAQEMWAVFLSGGLIGVILHRLWLMLLTSLCGVLVAWHAGFVLADTLGQLDAARWAADHAAALNGAAIAAAVIGILVQAATAPPETPAGEKPKTKKSKPKKAEKHAEKHADAADHHHHSEPAADHDHEPVKDADSHKSSGRGWLRLPGLKVA